MSQGSNTNNLTNKLFDEFTEILLEHGVTATEANDLTLSFGARWHFLPERALGPLKEIVHEMPLAKYLEKEELIKALCLQASEDLRLLIK